MNKLIYSHIFNECTIGTNRVLVTKDIVMDMRDIGRFHKGGIQISEQAIVTLCRVPSVVRGVCRVLNR